MMTREHVVWAAAIWVEKNYGEDASGFIAQRIGAHVLKDDIMGVEMWQKIAERYESLRRPEPIHS